MSERAVVPSAANGNAVAEPNVLREIEQRVLWLSTLMVHYANHEGKDPSGIKVGGHHASSASVVSLMTYLFFEYMRAGDRISVKPHAAPVLHAIHYLLGNLDPEYLRTLRHYHGLQAYPSRTKDPDPVDFSTGSMGLGSTAPNYAALVDRFVHLRRGTISGRRYLALVGDGELDEGSIWEAIAEPALADLDNLIWVVDVNRQSLDRVAPGIRVRQLEDMFRANGWEVIEAKYGRRLLRAFAETGGRLRHVIDEMSNEEYQLLLRSQPGDIRRALGRELLAGYDDAELIGLVGDLGGHDFEILRAAFARAEAAKRPAIVFAYTVKGWSLPIAGDPLNHQALLSHEEVEQLRFRLGIPEGQEWSRFPVGSPAAARCDARRRELARAPVTEAMLPGVPAELGRSYGRATSTQQALGLILTIIAREHPELAARMVTVSPDVAISTNLGGWINHVGLFEPTERADLFTRLGPRLVSWRRGPQGRHIELGISETNLMMALGQLGLSAELTGEPLYPIGTLYDPFVARALEALLYGLYCGGRFIIVGTPSGITLASEGGAHQSIVTPPLGIAVPGLVYWEPCFAQELEWILFDALQALHDPARREGAYLRLSTAPIDQSLLGPTDREALRRHVLSGAYRIVDRGPKVAVEIWATGVTVPEAITASDALLAEGIAANVVNCTSPGLVYRAWQRSSADGSRYEWSGGAQGPIVTVIDGHPSGLGWVGSMRGARAFPLGVTRYGESGSKDDLYRAHKIDAASVAAACRAVMTASR